MTTYKSFSKDLELLHFQKLKILSRIEQKYLILS